MNLETGEWKDGILTRIARDIMELSDETMCWIIFDGDIDPEWIEALNSVLDDNKYSSIHVENNFK